MTPFTPGINVSPVSTVRSDCDVISLSSSRSILLVSEKNPDEYIEEEEEQRIVVAVFPFLIK